MEFKDKLIELRLEKNISQVQLAKQIGVSNTAISFLESGRNQPTLFIIKKIAEFFNVSADYLIGLNENNPDPTITVRTAARGKGVEEREVNKEEYLAKLKKLEESREKDLAEIEELRKKLNGK